MSKIFGFFLVAALCLLAGIGATAAVIGFYDPFARGFMGAQLAPIVLILVLVVGALILAREV